MKSERSVLWLVCVALLASLTVLFGTGCGDDDSASGDADTDTDSDSDTDADSDGDSDADSDSDSDTDSDTDGDTDADSDTDTDADSDTGTCTDDSIEQPESDRVWKRCPIGQTWNTVTCVCDGEPTMLEWDPYDTAICDDPWRYPYKSELFVVLDGCESNVIDNDGNGYCNSCDASDLCAELFPDDAAADSAPYWTADNYSPGMAWFYDMSDGWIGVMSKTDSNRVRCVRQ